MNDVASREIFLAPSSYTLKTITSANVFDNSISLYTIHLGLPLARCPEMNRTVRKSKGPPGKKVLLRISIWLSCYFAGFHVANRAVTLLLLLRRCMKSFSTFCSEYSSARPSTGQVRSLTACVCRSFHDARGDQLFALNRDCDDRAISRMLCTGA